MSRLSGWVYAHPLLTTACNTTPAAVPKPVAAAVREVEGRSKSGDGACNEDVKRFCRAVKPGGGQILQCLQSHGQEVSDRCYQSLPKGTVLFK